MAKKRARPRKVKKAKNNIKPLAILAVIVVIALIAVAASMTPSYMQPAGSQQTTQGEVTQTQTNNQPCVRDSQCFVVSCKNNPSISSCVNAVNVELFYKNCNPANYTNVNVPKNTQTCICVNGNCQMLS